MEEIVELKQQGKFFGAKHASAYILWYLLSYKVLNSRVSFPIGSLQKVLTILAEHQISVRVIKGEEIENITVKNNHFTEVLERAKKKWLEDKKIREVFEKLQKASKEDMTKIVDYMNEVL